MDHDNQHLETLQDIRRIMNRSSRFISLSGLSGIAAGIWAVAGALIAKAWIMNYNSPYLLSNNSSIRLPQLKVNLFLLAAAVLAASLLSAFYFTWKRAGKNNLPLWDHASKMLMVNMLIPLITGGLFILTLIQYATWHYIAPCCLIFYGLSLVNGSKYTLSDIRYLGLMEIVLGLLNTQFPGYSIYFWAGGFGVLHIIYGFLMWWKNERIANTSPAF